MTIISPYKLSYLYTTVYPVQLPIYQLKNNPELIKFINTDDSIKRKLEEDIHKLTVDEINEIIIKDQVKKYLEQSHNGILVNLSFNIIEYYNSEEISRDYFNKQFNYASTLSRRDILTVSSYCFNGDKILNSYLQNKFDFESFKKMFSDKQKYHDYLFPFFPQFIDFVFRRNKGFVSTQNYSFENYKILLEKGDKLNKFSWFVIFENYITDLRKIIKEAPKLSVPMTVYRGMSNNWLYNLANNNTGITHKPGQFVSTSIDAENAAAFIEGNNSLSGSCCMNTLTLPVGSSTLCLMPFTPYYTEMEILLPDDSIFSFPTPNNHEMILDERTYQNTDITVENNDSLFKFGTSVNTQINKDIAYLVKLKC
jgi:hypothetical protein